MNDILAYMTVVSLCVSGLASLIAASCWLYIARELERDRRARLSSLEGDTGSRQLAIAIDRQRALNSDLRYWVQYLEWELDRITKPSPTPDKPDPETN